MADDRKKANVNLRDRFAYLSRDLCEYNSGSSDDDEEDNAAETETKRDVSFISKPCVDTDTTSSTSNSKDRVPDCGQPQLLKGDKNHPILPSATDIFKTVAKPDFLDTNKSDINWDKYAKNKLKDSSEADVSSMDSHQVPPPSTYDAQSEPLRPTLGVLSVTHSNKRSLDADAEDYEDNEDASPVKKKL